MATCLTLNPIVRITRVPQHPRERFGVPTAAVGAGRSRGVRGRRGNRVRGWNETGARSFHDALQWLTCTDTGIDTSQGDSRTTWTRVLEFRVTGISILASELGGMLHQYTPLGTKFLSLRSRIMSFRSPTTWNRRRVMRSCEKRVALLLA